VAVELNGDGSEDSRANDLRVLVWNLHGMYAGSRTRRRIRLAVQRIVDARPDVVLLQEIWPTQLVPIVSRFFGTSYRPVEGPTSRINVQLGGLMAFVSRHARGLAFVESEYLPFESSAPWWRVREGDGLGRKGIQRLELDTPAGRFAVLNTHVQSPYPGRDYREVRRRQLRQLADVGNGLVARMPVLAAGDLNTEADEEIFAEALGGWNDLTLAHRTSLGGSSHIEDDGSAGGWIDHVLARDHAALAVRARHLELIENHRVDDPFSDHHGLCIDLSLDG